MAVRATTRQGLRRQHEGGMGAVLPGSGRPQGWHFVAGKRSLPPIRWLLAPIQRPVRRRFAHIHRLSGRSIFCGQNPAHLPRTKPAGWTPASGRRPRHAFIPARAGQPACCHSTIRHESANTSEQSCDLQSTALFGSNFDRTRLPASHWS